MASSSSSPPRVCFFRKSDPPEVQSPARPAAIALGGVVGLLSGLTGTGGGIFLTPLLLFFRWARIRKAAAVSALFILVNSIAGLAGCFIAHRSVPSLGLLLSGAAVVGGTAGSISAAGAFRSGRFR